MSLPSIVETMCFPAFERAAAAVASFELRVRLLADSGIEGSSLQRQALGGDLTPLIEVLCKDFNATEEELKFLKAVAAIRNKLLHLELSKVTGRIRPLAEQLAEGGTWVVDLKDGAVAQVAKTSTQTGRIYGWLWESNESGAFDALVAAAERAMSIIRTLRDKRVAEQLAAARRDP